MSDCFHMEFLWGNMVTEKLIRILNNPYQTLCPFVRFIRPILLHEGMIIAGAIPSKPNLFYRQVEGTRHTTMSLYALKP